MNTPRGLRRTAQKVIIESLFDYAKAHKTLTRKSSDAKAKARAAASQKEIVDFFEGRHSDPWFELSEYNLELLYANFQDFINNPERMISVLKLRVTE